MRRRRRRGQEGVNGKGAEKQAALTRGARSKSNGNSYHRRQTWPRRERQRRARRQFCAESRLRIRSPPRPSPLPPVTGSISCIAHWRRRRWCYVGVRACVCVCVGVCVRACVCVCVDPWACICARARVPMNRRPATPPQPTVTSTPGLYRHRAKRSAPK